MRNPYGLCGHTYYEGSPDCVHHAYLRGYVNALDAAREAVAAVESDPGAEIDYDRDYRADPSGGTRNPRMWMRDALAAIDSLRSDCGKKHLRDNQWGDCE